MFYKISYRDIIGGEGLSFKRGTFKKRARFINRRLNLPLIYYNLILNVFGAYRYTNSSEMAQYARQNKMAAIPNGMVGNFKNIMM